MAGSLEPRRHLDLEGAYNIRDIGGYATSDGRSTRWQILLRADSLHRLAPASVTALIEYGLRTVIDLRTTDELQQAPDVLSNSSDFNYIHRNILGDPRASETSGSRPPLVDAKMLFELYTTMLDQRRAVIIETLETLAAPGALPALFHCFAGKDRTGLITALVLGLAGVPAETIAEDYALSSGYLSKRYFDPEAAPEIDALGFTFEQFQREVCYCSPDLMLETLRYIDERYGGAERYVRDGGLTQEQIDRLRISLLD